MVTAKLFSIMMKCLEVLTFLALLRISDFSGLGKCPIYDAIQDFNVSRVSRVLDDKLMAIFRFSTVRRALVRSGAIFLPDGINNQLRYCRTDPARNGSDGGLGEIRWENVLEENFERRSGNSQRQIAQYFSVSSEQQPS